MDLIYGPIKSQRYGNSLGINLLGNTKVCSYNCVYCHLGPSEMTMNKIRKDYPFPTADEIALAFKAHNASTAPIDTIVVSGNGEPTLHPEFEEVMRRLLILRADHMPDKKIVVLSNGAHLDNKKVVSGMNLIDERVIKIDAGNDVVMSRVNDPLVRMNMAKFLSHLGRLKDVTVQALFVQGEVVNTNTEMLDDWIEVLGMIKPKAVQICTLSRPGFKPGITACEDDTLYSIAFKLKKRTGLESQVFTAQK